MYDNNGKDISEKHLDIKKIDTETHGKPWPCFSAGRGEDGTIMVSFDFNGHHLEAEIFNDEGRVEAFYFNRNTNRMWEDTASIWTPSEWAKKIGKTKGNENGSDLQRTGETGEKGTQDSPTEIS